MRSQDEVLSPKPYKDAPYRDPSWTKSLGAAFTLGFDRGSSISQKSFGVIKGPGLYVACTVDER